MVQHLQKSQQQVKTFREAATLVMVANRFGGCLIEAKAEMVHVLQMNCSAAKMMWSLFILWPFLIHRTATVTGAPHSDGGSSSSLASSLLAASEH